MMDLTNTEMLRQISLEANAVKAECARYRAALEEIRDADYGTDVQDSDFESGLKQGLYAASKIAHRALHPEEE